MAVAKDGAAKDRITSDIPGRIRVRVAPHKRGVDKMEAVRSRLHTVRGVGDVHIVHHSGSVLVNYDTQSQTRESVIGELKFVGVDVVTKLEGEDGGEPTDIATAIIDAVGDANQRFSRATGRRADMRLIIPVGLGALGVYRMLREGITFAIPGYLLLWWGFDLFWKIHVGAKEPGANAATHAG